MEQPARRIAVTGAGFIGTALARRQVDAGASVIGVDLDDSARATWESFGAELVVGDITDPTSMASFVAGCDTVVHTAAIVEESGEVARFERVNVHGARTVAEAARDAGAQRFVHFSSVMVHGFDFADGVSEDGPLDGADNPYCTTKVASEAAVLALHDPGVFDVYVIRPGDVYGPGSVPWVLRPVALLRDGLWATIGADLEPIQNHVYVDNLLDGIDCVLDAGRSGEPFTITDGVRTTTMDYFGRLAAMVGIDELPRVSVADALAFGVDPEAVRYLTRRGTYAIDKVRSLGYEPKIDLDEGMARTGSWLEAEGLIDS